MSQAKKQYDHYLNSLRYLAEEKNIPFSELLSTGILEQKNKLNRLSDLAKWQPEDRLIELGRVQFYEWLANLVMKTTNDDIAKMAENKAKRDMASRGGKAKVASDPKQKEKTFIFECWQQWQHSPTTYPTKAAFARDMLEKCAYLTSQKKIEDWCREWEKPNPAG